MEKVLFVFELDHTLWNCSTGKHSQLEPPFRKEDKSLKDRSGNELYVYPEVSKVLDQIKKANYEIVFTSTSENPSQTLELLQLTGLDNYPFLTLFNDQPKPEQLQSIASKSGTPVANMIYFDVSRKNIEEIKPLGTTTFLIPDEGLTHDTFMVSMKNAGLLLDLDRLGITWGKKENPGS